MKKVLLLGLMILALGALSNRASAAEADIYCLNTSATPKVYQPCGIASNPVAVTIGSGGTVLTQIKKTKFNITLPTGTNNFSAGQSIGGLVTVNVGAATGYLTGVAYGANLLGPLPNLTYFAFEKSVSGCTNASGMSVGYADSKSMFSTQTVALSNGDGNLGAYTGHTGVLGNSQMYTPDGSGNIYFCVEIVGSSGVSNATGDWTMQVEVEN